MNTPIPARPKHHPLRAALQVAGFVAGLALLGWCVSVALRPENREQLAKLGDAEPRLVIAILVLSLLSLFFNGVVFWVTIRPVHRVGFWGMLATNALATFLNYLPFKIGVLTRLLIHNRRDGIPVLTISAWFMAIGIIVLGTIVPLVLVSLWRHQADTLWFIASGVGLLGAWALIVGIATPLSGAAGLRRFSRWGDFWGGQLHRRIIASRFFLQFHAGLALLANGRTVAAGMALRLVDVGVQTARFMVAAAILHHDFPADRALIAASTYFLIGILSPSGMLGTREGGTATLLTLPGMSSSEDASWFFAATLLVGASELLINLAGAAVGVLYLRPDRLLRHGAIAIQAAQSASVPEALAPTTPPNQP